MDSRLTELEEWLTNVAKLEIAKLEPASEDASFRRYFRVTTKSATSLIAMDAPPDKEPIDTFVTLAKQLRALNLHAPKIYLDDPKQGFILLEDLGDQTYFSALPANADQLYSDAISALVILQTKSLTQSHQPEKYDAHKLVTEMELFRSWFLERHLQTQPYEAAHAVWLQTKQFLVYECLNQPQVWVHRDYHSRNLMLTEQNSPGIIDFQDLVVGPIAYDLASIFKDCYIQWPRAQQMDWLANYFDQYQEAATSAYSDAAFDFEQLVRWYDLTGLQRHLKVLGIFCRLNYRDNKNHYLSDLPLVARYVLDVLPRYPELNEFARHYTHLIEKVL